MSSISKEEILIQAINMVIIQNQEKKKLTREILEKAIEFYKEEHSINQTCKMLSEKCGIKRSREALRKRLNKTGISLRTRSETSKLFSIKKLPQKIIEEIIDKYCNHKHSIRKISRDLKLTRVIIKRTLIESGKQIRNNDTAIRLTNQKYAKHQFSGNDKEKAYILGLVRGDLTALKRSRNTLRLSVASTHKNFLDFLKSYFIKYGHSHIYPTKNKLNYQWNISIDIDIKSFNFLIESKNNNDLAFNDITFFCFLAGLIDSDGAVFIRKSGKYVQYIIRIFGEDKELLEKIKDRLKDMRFHPSFYVCSKKGETRYLSNIRIVYNKDYYILEISRKDETFRMLNELPLKHPEKIARKEIMTKLIKKGVINHSDTGEMVELRDKIDKDIKKYVEEAKTNYLARNKD